MGIVIEAEARETIPVTLVGVEYQITPPKWALAMKMAVQAKTTAKDDPTVMIETIYEWVDKAFGKTQAKKVRARLDDENDNLDFKHLMVLMEKIVEVQAEEETPTS
jgi:hypothetical protein